MLGCHLEVVPNRRPVHSQVASATPAATVGLFTVGQVGTLHVVDAVSSAHLIS